MARDPPLGYTTPPFPSLGIKDIADFTPGRRHSLFYLSDVWLFTVLWTLIVYAAFHLGAVVVACFMHSWNKSSWKSVWLILIPYLVIAGVEAVLAGTIVGLIVGAVYRAGYYEMNTWIPFTWAFISVLVLIISSFAIQGGL
ncbi:Uncharacterized protein ESCO_000179 [Escovopsis weberi]|uniref:Integral membrane protein n=1 Tax=Escovopsis weberi TaxID=150374 RepID=A0A0M8N2V3_ESCWE|nr:Uncharacterized protein ESCO_000179 [Escovopsis weberi]